MDRQLLPKPQEPSPAGPSSTTPESTVKQKRRKENVTPVACAECKRKKSKCDGGKPGCKRCAERGVECVYSTVSSSQRVAVLRERVKELEAKLKETQFENALLTAGSRNQASQMSLQQQPSPISSSASATNRNTEMPLGAMPLDMTGSGTSFQIHEYGHEENTIIPAHRILPHQFFDDDSTKLGCTDFYLECRRALAQGTNPNEVLGDQVIDVSGIVHGQNIEHSQRFSKWAVMFTMNLGDCSWEVQLAFAYSAFHLMRWLVLPTEENFARLPEFAKPTIMQSPESRDAFIKHQGVFMPFHWIEVRLQTRIRWLGEVSSAVQLDPVSAQINLSPSFEAAIRDPENWIFPSLLDIVGVPGPNSPSIDLTDGLTDGLASQDGG